MIREAQINDAQRIAEIEVMSSRFAYKGIVSDDCLFKDLTVEGRTPVISRWINEKIFDLYVYEDPETGSVMGMMGMGMCGDDDKKEAFELHFIYVDPSYIRKGAGSEMMAFFEQKGKEKGAGEFVVWVLEENKLAQNFYLKHNFRLEGQVKIFKRWNTREIRFVKN